MSLILYTFRRCPYAIRARMALSYAQISYEPYEVNLKKKPLDLIKASPKATVPVLILENGQVIDESIEIIKWSLKQSDPEGWLTAQLEPQGDKLINLNDKYFKPLLDNYKYSQKSEKKDPAYYRDEAKAYLGQLNSLLTTHSYLLAEHISFADIALFPFIRQFYMVDELWFKENDYDFLQTWLDYFLNSKLFLRVMTKSD